MRLLSRTLVALAISALLGFAHPLTAQPVVETVFYDMPLALLPDPVPQPSAQLLTVPGYPDDAERLTFIARLYLPDAAVHGPGPYPVVLFIHGSGGFWPGNNIPSPITTTNAPSLQFRDWGNQLVALGYACLLPDSFHPRGITSSFSGRLPHHDPDLDDALCSPNYERPKDVIAAIRYLADHPDVDAQRLALIGFSHGAQTAMNALVDPSIDLGEYTVNFIQRFPDPEDPDNPEAFIEAGVSKVVPSPVRLPDDLPAPKVGFFFYGGGGHFGYHGQASSTSAGRYMMDRRVTALLFHGTGDSLMGISDHASIPKAGSVFPIKQVLASGAQAAALGLPNPIVRHYIFDRTDVHPGDLRVGHSFDLGSVGWAAPEDQDTAEESPNQKARRLTRQEVLRWLDFTLQPPPTLTASLGPESLFAAHWPTRTPLTYQLQSSETLAPESWTEAVPWAHGTGAPSLHPTPVDPGTARFFRLRYQPVPMPVEAPENAGFFVDYSAFGL